MELALVLFLFPVCSMAVERINVYSRCISHSECPANSRCRPSSCDGFTCLCDQGFIASEDRKECFKAVKIGQPCSAPGSRCMSPFATCDLGRCRCFDVFIPSVDGRCKLPNTNFLGEDCGKCEYPSTCIEGTCQCVDKFRPPTEEEFWVDPMSTLQCRPKKYSLSKCNKTVVPAPDELKGEITYPTLPMLSKKTPITVMEEMTPDSQTAPEEIQVLYGTCVSHNQCPDNSMCKPNACDGYVCLCNEGYITTVDRKSCVKGKRIDEPCNTVTDRCISSFSTCNGTCKCIDKFVKTTDGRCTLPGSNFVGETCGIADACEYPADCVDGICRCITPYRQLTTEEFWTDPTLAIQCRPLGYSASRCNGTEIDIPPALQGRNSEPLARDNRKITSLRTGSLDIYKHSTLPFTTSTPSSTWLKTLLADDLYPFVSKPKGVVPHTPVKTMNTHNNLVNDDNTKSNLHTIKPNPNQDLTVGYTSGDNSTLSPVQKHNLADNTLPLSAQPNPKLSGQMPDKQNTFKTYDLNQHTSQVLFSPVQVTGTKQNTLKIETQKFDIAPKTVSEGMSGGVSAFDRADTEHNRTRTSSPEASVAKTSIEIPEANDTIQENKTTMLATSENINMQEKLNTLAPDASITTMPLEENHSSNETKLAHDNQPYVNTPTESADNPIALPVPATPEGNNSLHETKLASDNQPFINTLTASANTSIELTMSSSPGEDNSVSETETASSNQLYAQFDNSGTQQPRVNQITSTDNSSASRNVNQSKGKASSPGSTLYNDGISGYTQTANATNIGLAINEDIGSAIEIINENKTDIGISLNPNTNSVIENVLEQQETTASAEFTLNTDMRSDINTTTSVVPTPADHLDLDLMATPVKETSMKPQSTFEHVSVNVEDKRLDSFSGVAVLSSSVADTTPLPDVLSNDTVKQVDYLPDQIFNSEDTITSNDSTIEASAVQEPNTSYEIQPLRVSGSSTVTMSFAEQTELESTTAATLGPPHTTELPIKNTPSTGIFQTSNSTQIINSETTISADSDLGSGPPLRTTVGRSPGSAVIGNTYAGVMPEQSGSVVDNIIVTTTTGNTAEYANDQLAKNTIRSTGTTIPKSDRSNQSQSEVTATNMSQLEHNYDNSKSPFIQENVSSSPQVEPKYKNVLENENQFSGGTDPSTNITTGTILGERTLESTTHGIVTQAQTDLDAQNAPSAMNHDQANQSVSEKPRVSTAKITSRETLFNVTKPEITTEKTEVVVSETKTAYTGERNSTTTTIPILRNRLDISLNRTEHMYLVADQPRRSRNRNKVGILDIIKRLDRNPLMFYNGSTRISLSSKRPYNVVIPDRDRMLNVNAPLRVTHENGLSKIGSSREGLYMYFRGGDVTLTTDESQVLHEESITGQGARSKRSVNNSIVGNMEGLEQQFGPLLARRFRPELHPNEIYDKRVTLSKSPTKFTLSGSSLNILTSNASKLQAMYRNGTVIISPRHGDVLPIYSIDNKIKLLENVSFISLKGGNLTVTHSNSYNNLKITGGKISISNSKRTKRILQKKLELVVSFDGIQGVMVQSFESDFAASFLGNISAVNDMKTFTISQQRGESTLKVYHGSYMSFIIYKNKQYLRLSKANLSMLFQEHTEVAYKDGMFRFLNQGGKTESHIGESSLVLKTLGGSTTLRDKTGDVLVEHHNGTTLYAAKRGMLSNMKDVFSFPDEEMSTSKHAGVEQRRPQEIQEDVATSKQGDVQTDSPDVSHVTDSNNPLQQITPDADLFKNEEAYMSQDAGVTKPSTDSKSATSNVKIRNDEKLSNSTVKDLNPEDAVNTTEEAPTLLIEGTHQVQETDSILIPLNIAGILAVACFALIVALVLKSRRKRKKGEPLDPQSTASSSVKSNTGDDALSRLSPGGTLKIPRPSIIYPSQHESDGGRTVSTNGRGSQYAPPYTGNSSFKDKSLRRHSSVGVIHGYAEAVSDRF